MRSISPRLCSCDIHDGHFVDRHVQDIEKFIHEETKALGKTFHNSRKERFGVFKNAFDMLIDESTSFKPLLADINAEYLRVIKAVEKGEEQRAYMSRDLKCVVGERFTKENYEKRIQELEKKAKLIKANNEHLREKYKQIQAEEMEVCPEIGKTATSNNNLVKQSHLVLPGLRIEEQTDINVLSSALEKLRIKVQAMKQKTKINYYPKEKKMLLGKNLKEKERSRNHVSRYNKALREKLGRLTITVEASKSSRLPSKDVPKTELVDVMLKALNDYEKMDSSRKYDPLQQHISTDDDDPSKKKESEKLVSYIEHFNDLFDFAQYEAAAIHAATSPLAILRTPQAMQKFKEVEVFEGPKSPLFLYCEALMTTSIIDSESFKLTPSMSLECISCALKESGINLAIHWLNHPCIVTSIPLADLLVDWCRCIVNCSCKCQALAEGMYRKFDAHQQVATTLARQGKHRAIIEYGRTNGGFKLADYKAILESNPTILYAIMLLQSNVNRTKLECGISFCCIVNILLTSNEEVLVSFLEHIYSTGICDSRRLNYSISDLVFLEKSSDGMTGEKWNRVMDICCSKGRLTISMELLSTLLVRQALNHASISSSMDYIS